MQFVYIRFYLMIYNICLVIKLIINRFNYKYLLKFNIEIIFNSIKN